MLLCDIAPWLNTGENAVLSLPSKLNGICVSCPKPPCEVCGDTLEVPHLMFSRLAWELLGVSVFWGVFCFFMMDKKIWNFFSFQEKINTLILF